MASSSIAEYFTLRDASATAARIPETKRKEIADALALGRQKAEAAEALWSNGHAAEGLRLVVEALTATLEAAPRYDGATSAPAKEPAKPEGEVEGAESDAPKSEPPPPATWRTVLAARGVSADRLNAIAEAEEKARTTTLPRLDADVNAAHADLYQQIARARLDVERALAYAAMSPRELGVTRIARIATAAVLGVALIAALVFVMRTPHEVTADASATFANSPTFGAGNAIDGDVNSEWLLPDRASGWVETRLSPPRHVARVTLTNAKNAPHFDRATREYRIELYSGGRVVEQIDGEFASFERDPQPVSHDFDADGIDRVRFVSRSHHNLGGGLAEMTVEE
ncbi:discoidin domain-containing protein [Sandaracinus amylolyticus]|uniref:discoidin domain-containing protein n=1 Tax=Sandaracinus amylolyticus TaxID=927083 RepID=UPI001F16F512|nr:discoidin domain-containing protein [Sandaracinus amylolyticus]UJR81282.1 F5/8 type C domain-containing protein [Sandaracinus amylolyticus]